MKFTSTDLAKAMGLKAGFKIKFSYNMTATIVTNNGSYYYQYDNDCDKYSIKQLIDDDGDWEIIKTELKVGNKQCGELDIMCKNCQYCEIETYKGRPGRIYCVNENSPACFSLIEGNKIKK